MNTNLDSLRADGPNLDGLIVRFTRPIPQMVEWPTTEQHMFYQEEAAAVLDALYAHLPGGLIDALFTALCHRKASLLRVPLQPEEPSL